MAEKSTTGFLVSYKPTVVNRQRTSSTITPPMNNYYNFINQSTRPSSTSETSSETPTETSGSFKWKYRNPIGVSSYGFGNVKFNDKVRSVGDVLSTLQQNIDQLDYKKTGRGKHTCTRAVVHALTGQTNYNIQSGVENPEALYNLLTQQGWTDVLNDSYTPQPGDVYTVWGVGGQYGMHSSMYNGSNWGSYTTEGTTPYFYTKRNQPGVKMHVMRYISKSKNGGVIHGISRLIGVV